MQKISRIYLGNCGYTTAWYDGVTLDLTDPDSGLPTDTIINLENGGGKTSLLSLIFSCFETREDKFLKHIQSKNNHFSQYFAQDGLPGLILVEWLMPERTAGKGPHRMVMGQAVSVKASSDQHETDRIFFSFEGRADLGFTDVPGPHLSDAPAMTMAEFSRWVHDEQKKHPGDVYVTRKQGDWQRHLKDERLIDIEMLQMQVSFSAQEGGFDTGFLNFHSEIEFLRKFFHLTLDTQRATSVRDGVASTCDKHRRKPQYQKRLTELTKFRGVLNVFAQAAQEFQNAAARQKSVLVEGARLACALQDRSAERREANRNEKTYEGEQRGFAAAAVKDSYLFTRSACTATSLWHQRRVARTSGRKDAADKLVKDLKDKHKHVRAARSQQEIQALATRIEEMEALASLALEGLKPVRDHVETQGALLRRALHNEEQALRGEVELMGKRDAERATQSAKHKKDLQDLALQEKRATSEQAQLSAAERSFLDQRGRHVSSGLLVDDAEATLEAVARWRQEAGQRRVEKAALELEAAEFTKHSKDWSQAAVREGQAAVRIEGEIKSNNSFIAEGEAEVERLSSVPAILSAAESDKVDPESPALTPLLQQAVSASAQEVSLSDVRLADLTATRQAIADTGVAGRSPDVALVVAHLRDNEVRSARPFNEYISQAVPDADRARELVLSDPARFLNGVSIASSELEKARGVAWGGRRPTRPVVISGTALDPQPGAADEIVVPAESDAAFNRDAATRLALTLQDRNADEETRREAFYARQTGAMAALQQLDAFRQRFGDGRLAAARGKVSTLLAELEAVNRRVAEANGKAAEASEKAAQRQQQAQVKASEAQTADGNAKTLQDFFEHFEAGRDARLERLEVLKEMFEEIAGSRLLASEALETIDAESQRDFKKKVRYEGDADKLGHERGAITLYSREYPAQEHLKANPIDLETLRSTYADAESTYKTKEESQLGVLQEKLEGARKQRVDKTRDFTRDFPGVNTVHIKPYLGMDHTEMIPDIELELEHAESEQLAAGTEHGVTSRDSKEWHQSNSANIDKATPEQEALDEGALFKLKGEDEQRVQDALARMKSATEEADKALGRAKSRLQEAEADEKLDSLLKTMLSLPDRPNPTLLALELAAITGGAVDATEQAPIVLELDATNQVKRVLAEHTGKGKGLEKARDEAQLAFDKVKGAAGEKDLQDVEPDLARQMLTNDFSAACSDGDRLLEHLDDRIGTTKETLDKMQADFDDCVEEVLVVSRLAVSLLASATNNKRVPAGAPYVAGKPVLKMRANFPAVSLDMRRQALRHYLDSLVDTNVIPQRGADLIAEAVLRIHGKPLGLQVLKMVIDESQQYVAVDKIANSGAEGVVMAMFLYVVINQLRAETQAKLQKTGGGPLILDNPFAKATTPALWKAQRLLAAAMDVQLIFATALQDYNTIAEFQRFIRLRKAGQNSKTNRWHLEAATFKLNETVPEAA